MNATEIKIAEILSSTLYLSKEDIKEDTDVFKDLGADSLDILTLAGELENEFNVEVTDNEFSRIVSVKEIIKLIKEKQS